MAVSKISSDELASWHKSNPVKDLFYSQKEVARFLEWGYLELRTNAKLAAEIRNTAHEARTQHILTAGLFKKFGVTANNVVNLYVPMMFEAIESKDKETVIEAFGNVLDMVLDMKKETENTRDSWSMFENILADGSWGIRRKPEIGLMVANSGFTLVSKKKLQSELGLVNAEKQEITLKTGQTECLQKYEKLLADEASKRKHELEQEEAELKAKVKKLRTNSDLWLEQSVPASGVGDIVHTVIDFVMFPSNAMVVGYLGYAVGGPFGAVIGGAVGLAVGTANRGLNILSKSEKADQAIKASHEAQIQVKQTKDEMREVEKTASEKSKETLDRLAHIEALELEKASLGDNRGLMEAVFQLGYVDIQFTKIIQFWDSMAAMLKHLHQNQTAGGVYLKHIEKHADKFITSLKKTELDWNRIGLVCQDYVRENEKVIFEVYGFLSEPVDNMYDDEIAVRKKKLTAVIREDAENLTDQSSIS